MASEILKLTTEIVVSHASLTELTPEQLVNEINEVYNALAALDSGGTLEEPDSATAPPPAQFVPSANAVHLPDQNPCEP